MAAGGGAGGGLPGRLAGWLAGCMAGGAAGRYAGLAAAWIVSFCLDCVLLPAGRVQKPTLFRISLSGWVRAL